MSGFMPLVAPELSVLPFLRWCCVCHCVSSCTACVPSRAFHLPVLLLHLVSFAGQQYGAGLTVAGLLLGGAFIRWVQQQLAAYEDIQFGDLQGSSGACDPVLVCACLWQRAGQWPGLTAVSLWRGLTGIIWVVSCHRLKGPVRQNLGRSRRLPGALEGAAQRATMLLHQRLWCLDTRAALQRCLLLVNAGQVPITPHCFAAAVRSLCACFTYNHCSPQDGADGGHHGGTCAGRGLRCRGVLLRRARLGSGVCCFSCVCVLACD